MNQKPKHETPDPGWEHYELWKRVQESTMLLASKFNSVINIGGVDAVELYAYGSILGAAIEREVVRCLNDLRRIWDRDSKYAPYSFMRQAQTYPDVILTDDRSPDRTPDRILLGIELKSWYVLAKEGEPSFRFKTNIGACPPQDLLVLVPWYLSNILSGMPMILDPYVESTRYLARYRNCWWRNTRQSSGNVTIEEPTGVRPYPGARENISDSPADDKGNNFGRIARTNLLDDFKGKTDNAVVSGIRVAEWRNFFKAQKT